MSTKPVPSWRILYGLLAVIGVLLLTGGCASSLRNRSTIPGKTIVGREYPSERSPSSLERLQEIVDTYIGVEYKYAGVTRDGVDCSGLVFLVFKEYNGLSMPHSSAKLYAMGEPVSREQAQMGDLVFFKSSDWGAIDHVGIYMGEGRFVHASTSLGVMYDSLNDPHYGELCSGFRRILG